MNSFLKTFMYNISKIEKVVKGMMSEYRWKHTKAVEKFAIKLAKKWDVSVEKASIAAVLHDACKELDAKKTIKLTQDDPRFSEYPNINTLHGVAASVFASKKFGIDDEEIIEAIANHVIPKKKVGKLTKIIYIADKLEPTRKKYLNIINPIYYRELAFENLNSCFAALVKRNKR